MVLTICQEQSEAEVHKSRAPGRLGDCILQGGAYNFQRNYYCLCPYYV